jgi:cytochrome c biogenesis protein CcdA
MIADFACWCAQTVTPFPAWCDAGHQWAAPVGFAAGLLLFASPLLVPVLASVCALKMAER